MPAAGKRKKVSETTTAEPAADVATGDRSAATSGKVTTFKGFDHNFQCRGHQFEVGKTYKVEGAIKACSNGFHACENPFDVWSYYSVVNDDGELSRYAVVEQSGALARHDEDSKIASAEITIKAELTLPEFIKSAVDWLIENTKGKSGDDIQSSSEFKAHLAASGDSSHLAASGDYSHLAASGDYSHLAASGYSSHLAASGDSSHLAASGYSSHLAASGYSSRLAASGDYSHLAASGDSSHLAASGYSSHLAASGYSSRLAASGDYSVIAASAPGCRAKGANGTWISLPEFDGNNRCIGFAVGCIGDGLKEHTWYEAKGGKLVEAA